MRRLGLLIFVLSLFAVPATANAAIAGGLKQLPGAQGCFAGEDPAPAGCADARALNGVGDVTTSPDGKSVYVSSINNDSILIFDRASNGRLTQKSSILGCVTADATTATNENCNLIAPPNNAMDGPQGLAVSPDNKSLYTVTNSGRLTSFNRASDGSLTFNDHSPYSSGPLRSVTVSPDGRSVYLVGPDNSNAVGWYQRNTTAGTTLGDIGSGFGNCYGGVCGAVTNSGVWSDVAVTPDGKELLLTTSSNTAVLGWDRATTGTVGQLTPSTTADRCISNTDLGGTCQVRQGMNNGQSLSVNSNASFQWLSQYGVSTINRNASTNAITPDTAGNCFTYPGSSFAGCTPMPGSNCCSQWYQTRDIVSTKDGKNVYVGTEANGMTAGGLFGFNRIGAALQLKPAPLRCLSTAAQDSCTQLQNGNRFQAIAASSDSRNVYGGGNNRVWAFEVDRPPVCSNVSASTTLGTAVDVAVNCSDPDGDPLTFQKVAGSGPTGGSLADSFSGNRISYNAFRAGTDSFKFRAVAAGVASDNATATISVSAPAGPPPSGPGPSGPGTPTTVVPSTTSINSLAFAKYTKLLNLSAKNLQAGSTVVVTCKTKKKKQQKKGCAYKSKRFTTTGARAKLNLRKPFAKKKIPVGTKIAITITAPGFLGKKITYTMRARKLPSSRVQCLSASGRVGSCA